jgi:excisionase family DNA binding protein
MTRLLTPKEVADRLSVPLATLYSWRHRRQGPPALKVVGSLRYSAEDLDRWIADQRKEQR